VWKIYRNLLHLVIYENVLSPAVLGTILVSVSRMLIMLLIRKVENVMVKVTVMTLS